VYLDVDAEGPPALGKVSRQHFKGRFPYHLRTRSRIVRLEPPRVVAAEVDGDLRGHGIWTLTPIPAGTHVRFDWRVHADRPLLRLLTPLLRPAFRWTTTGRSRVRPRGSSPTPGEAARRRDRTPRRGHDRRARRSREAQGLHDALSISGHPGELKPETRDELRDLLRQPRGPWRPQRRESRPKGPCLHRNRPARRPFAPAGRFPRQRPWRRAAAFAE
jgi:hypothetical protein